MVCSFKRDEILSASSLVSNCVSWSFWAYVTILWLRLNVATVKSFWFHVAKPLQKMHRSLSKGVLFRAVQSAGLAGEKPGGFLKPGFLLPDRFEPTGPAKAGPAKKSRPGKKKPARQTENRPGEIKPARRNKTGPAKRKPARQEKAGPARKSRPGKQKTGPARKSRPANKKPARQSRAGRDWGRTALLVQTSQLWGHYCTACSAFPYIQMRVIYRRSC